MFLFFIVSTRADYLPPNSTSQLILRNQTTGALLTGNQISNYTLKSGNTILWSEKYNVTLNKGIMSVTHGNTQALSYTYFLNPNLMWVINTSDYEISYAELPVGMARVAEFALNVSWTNISGIPSGFADSVDNDTKYTHLSNFTNDKDFTNKSQVNDSIQGYFTNSSNISINGREIILTQSFLTSFTEADPIWLADKGNYYNINQTNQTILKLRNYTPYDGNLTINSDTNVITLIGTWFLNLFAKNADIENINNTISTNNASMKNYVDSQDGSLNTSLRSYISSNNDTIEIYIAGVNSSILSTDITTNNSMRVYVASTNTTILSYVDTANTSMRVYVNAQNDSMRIYVAGVNTSILNTDITTNNSMRVYVASTNTTILTYVDTVNASMRAYVASTNTTLFNYINTANSSMKEFVIATNSSMKTYVDSRPTSSSSNLSSGRFYNYTPITTTGSITNGSLVGYLAAAKICEGYYPGTHMCQTSEIINHIMFNQSLQNFTATFRISEGAPGYLANANDCDAWQSATGSSLGSIWVADDVDGGSASLVACNAARAIGCCIYG